MCNIYNSIIDKNIKEHYIIAILTWCDGHTHTQTFFKVYDTFPVKKLRILLICIYISDLCVYI